LISSQNTTAWNGRKGLVIPRVTVFGAEVSWREIGLKGFILFAPFAAWFSITGWLRPPVDFLLIALIASAPVLVVRFFKKPASLFISGEDVVLLVLSALIWVSFLYGPGTGKSFNHALSFTFCFTCYLMLFKRMWLDTRLPLMDLFRWALYAVILTDLIIIAEWGLLNLAGIKIRQYFIFTESVTNMNYYYQYFFLSVAGPAEEPSLICFNINALFPLGLYWLKTTGKQKELAWYVALHVITLIFTASSGGIGFLLIGFFVAHLLEYHPIQLLRMGLSVVGGVLMVFATYLLSPPALQLKAESFFVQITSKFLFTNASADMREGAWSHGIKDFLSSPWIGKGPAYGHHAYNMFGYQSTYVKLLAEMGIFSLLLYLLFLALVFVRLMKIKPPLRKYLAMSFVASTLHWAIADCYYHVSFWIAIAAIQLIHYEREQVRKLEGQRTIETTFSSLETK
jgi:hypothetical protein